MPLELPPSSSNKFNSHVEKNPSVLKKEVFLFSGKNISIRKTNWSPQGERFGKEVYISGKSTKDNLFIKELSPNKSLEKIEKLMQEKRFGLMDEGNVLKFEETWVSFIEIHDIKQATFKKASGEVVELKEFKVQTLTGEESAYLQKSIENLCAAIIRAQFKEVKSEKKEEEASTEPKAPSEGPPRQELKQLKPSDYLMLVVLVSSKQSKSAQEQDKLNREMAEKRQEERADVDKRSRIKAEVEKRDREKHTLETEVKKKGRVELGSQKSSEDIRVEP
jgi:hypothetical protein